MILLVKKNFIESAGRNDATSESSRELKWIDILTTPIQPSLEIDTSNNSGIATNTT